MDGKSRPMTFEEMAEAAASMFGCEPITQEEYSDCMRENLCRSPLPTVHVIPERLAVYATRVAGWK